jgi:hypothetical protein
MSATRQEVQTVITDLEQKNAKIREKMTELDDQIRSTSINSVEKLEGELDQLKNRYYEILARELIGEFDAKLKKDVEEGIQLVEKRLKLDSDRLQNLVGIRHALEGEFKKTLASMEQYHSVLERLEFEDLKLERQRIAEELSEHRQRIEEMFQRVSDYNLNSVAMVMRILNRERQQRGISSPVEHVAQYQDKVHQLAEPFDIDHIKSSMTAAISAISKPSLGLEVSN